MPMRTCVKCKSAENPLGRLRFKKSRINGKVYCENCDPDSRISSSAGTHDTPVVESAASPSLVPSSAGSMVVIQCPSCRSTPRGPHPAPCATCSDYGSVRIPVNYLNVYRPQLAAPAVVLTED